MTTEVSDNEARSRYELTVDGRQAAFADYHLVGEKVVMPHTVVDPSMRGQGLAAILVRHALDDIRSKGRAVVPSCWYVAQFIDQHPEYADLVSRAA